MSIKIDFNQVWPQLQKSKFRARFKLDAKDLAYIDKTGLEKVRLHAVDFIEKRLAPAIPKNDGKQTPYKGHPVFKAQHAAAVCCRGCIAKWHKIPKGKALSPEEISELSGLIMAWIEWDLRSKRIIA